MKELSEFELQRESVAVNSNPWEGRDMECTVRKPTIVLHGGSAILLAEQGYLSPLIHILTYRSLSSRKR